MSLLLGVACGGVAALPFLRLARRELARSRALVLSMPGSGARRRHRFPRFLAAHPVVSVIGRVASVPHRRRSARRREAVLQHELPVVVDLIAVGIGAGCTPLLAIRHTARYCPARSSTALLQVSRECALGRPLEMSLRDLGSSIPTLRGLCETLATSERLGSPAVPALARLATEVRVDVRRRAEARARTVPVRLCFPLVACVLPAFALLTVVPVVLGGLHG